MNPEPISPIVSQHHKLSGCKIEPAMEANKRARGHFQISIVASSLMELEEKEKQEEWELVVECNILHITVKFRKGYHRVLEA